MSISSEIFNQSIRDAENLLAHFNKLNTKPPPPENEVLKRAGLIMAMTAGETYVEDRLIEATSERLQSLSNSSIAEFIQSKLDEEIRRLHNPTSEKTIILFKDYAGIDLKDKWQWNNYDAKTVRNKLDHCIKLRGEVVHRSRVINSGIPQAHPVTKDDLEKTIRFLKILVETTEKALSPEKPR
jgi:hypothetical protein